MMKFSKTLLVVLGVVASLAFVGVMIYAVIQINQLHAVAIANRVAPEHLALTGRHSARLDTGQVGLADAEIDGVVPVVDGGHGLGRGRRRHRHGAGYAQEHAQRLRVRRGHSGRGNGRRRRQGPLRQAQAPVDQAGTRQNPQRESGQAQAPGRAGLRGRRKQSGCHSARL